MKTSKNIKISLRIILLYLIVIITSYTLIKEYFILFKYGCANKNNCNLIYSICKDHLYVLIRSCLFLAQTVLILNLIFKDEK